MLKNKVTTFLLIGGMGLTGLVAGVATIASAQSASTTIAPVATTTVAPTTVDTPEPGDTPDAPGAVESKTHGHAPLGGDGVVASISGTTIIVSEESDEGGASYTVDASKATVTNNGVAGSLADVKVGEKIFVEGVTTGTNVAATSISIGHKGGRGDKGNDADGSGAKEAAEPAGSSDAGE
jgi:hypothetical protein